MTAKFFAILTNQGAALLANATALGTKLNITQMAVGDGNGTLPTPDATQTKLVNQKRIAPLNMLSIDANNTSQIIAEQVIPENEGGFWIREIGLYDDNGVLIAVANCPETYKPQLQEGSGRTQTIRMVLIVSSTAAVTLKIDPSVVLATRQYIDDKVIEVKGYADTLLKQHIADTNPHKQYAPVASPVFTGTPKAPTAAQTSNDTQLANTAFVQAAIAALVSGELAKKQPLDNTLTELSGKSITGLLDYLGLREAVAGVSVVGASRNARMNIAAASVSANFIADEVIVATEPGGKLYRVPDFNKVVNLSVTGAGGMDTGTAPATGYIALYAIYKPDEKKSALLAVNATASSVPEIYGGVNMPAGYTASALVSVWRIASGQFVVGYQRNRHVSFPLTVVYATLTGVTAISGVSFATAVPKNAVTINGYLTVYENQPGTGVELSLYSSVTGIGQLRANATVTGQTSAAIANGELHVIESQTLYYNMPNTYSGQYGIGCTGYAF